MRQLAAQYNQLAAESALRNNLIVDPAALLFLQGANAGGQLENLQSPVDNGRGSRHRPDSLTSTQLVQNPICLEPQRSYACVRSGPSRYRRCGR